jgi:branched-subunit amino acid aminotransferase/4-amino-4-deoxychorismate lyase
MATVFLNGVFVPAGEAKVSAFDAGFQHGVGLFETMMAIASPQGGRPRVVMLWEHLERLKLSALSLGLVSTLHADALGEAVVRTAAKEAESSRDTERFRVRLTISGGDLNLLSRPGISASGSGGFGGSGGGGGGAGSHEPTLVVHVQPATAYPEEMFDRGVRAVIADLRVNPLDPTAGHKALNYWARLRELQRAAAAGAGEAMVFQVTNHLAGGCVSNAVLVRDGVMVTPIARGEEEEVASGAEFDPSRAAGVKPGGALPSPVLPGTVRRWLLDWAAASGIEVRRRMVTIDDVLSADELMLTNSSWGVLPVVQVEREMIAGGAVGEISRRAISAWSDVLAADASL